MPEGSDDGNHHHTADDGSHDDDDEEMISFVLSDNVHEVEIADLDEGTYHVCGKAVNKYDKVIQRECFQAEVVSGWRSVTSSDNTTTSSNNKQGSGEKDANTITRKLQRRKHPGR